VREIIGDEFERDLAIEARVFRGVDDAHAASTKLADDAIV
jgi:hypothetical protein